LASHGSDQAEGLRQLLAAPSCRVVTLLSAVDLVERDALLVNLAAALAHFGQKVILMDGSSTQPRLAERLGVASGPTLLDVASETCALSCAIHSPMPSFGFIDMSRGQRISSAAGKRLERVMDQLTSQCDVLLVTAEPAASHRLPIDALAAGDVVVQVSRRRSAITAGYGAIKGMSGLTGRRAFGLMITGTPDEEATTLYENMARVASRFLATSLNFVGSVPPDDCVARARAIGRPVVEAFPLAKASTALRRIADAIVHAANRNLRAASTPDGLQLGVITPHNRLPHVHSDGQGR
jgi:flagellar biosynthesis protein FlhG